MPRAAGCWEGGGFLAERDRAEAHREPQLAAREAIDRGGENPVERHSAGTDHELLHASLIYAGSTLTLQNLTEELKRHPEFWTPQP